MPGPAATARHKPVLAGESTTIQPPTIQPRKTLRGTVTQNGRPHSTVGETVSRKERHTMASNHTNGVHDVVHRIFGGYAELLRIPHTARFAVGSVIACMPFPMVGMTMTIMTQQYYGNYALAGALTAVQGQNRLVAGGCRRPGHCACSTDHGHISPHHGTTRGRLGHSGKIVRSSKEKEPAVSATTINFVRHGKVYNPNHVLYERRAVSVPDALAAEVVARFDQALVGEQFELLLPAFGAQRVQLDQDPPRRRTTAQGSDRHNPWKIRGGIVWTA